MLWTIGETTGRKSYGNRQWYIEGGMVTNAVMGANRPLSDRFRQCGWNPAFLWDRARPLGDRVRKGLVQGLRIAIAKLLICHRPNTGIA